jgi:hypothetical protein
MEHWYVINGNEFGVDLYTKKNFLNLKEAENHFENVKFDDFGCKIVYVDSFGIEKDVKTFINE